MIVSCNIFVAENRAKEAESKARCEMFSSVLTDMSVCLVYCWFGVNLSKI